LALWTGCLRRHIDVDGSTLRCTGLMGRCTLYYAIFDGCLKRHVDVLMFAQGADGDVDGDNDEELLLVDVEKKVERCKVVELFNAKT
jgi:hypothetical protein